MRVRSTPLSFDGLAAKQVHLFGLLFPLCNLGNYENNYIYFKLWSLNLFKHISKKFANIITIIFVKNN